jgi:hypothetical protein
MGGDNTPLPLIYTHMKNIVDREKYDLLLSYDPCDIFNYYNVDEMHGLNLHDCVNHNNTNQSAYIAGWCNLIPNSDRHYVFINLSRCNTDIETFGLIMHELMHLSFDLHTDEEEIITWAENESYQVFEIITKLKS